MQRKNGSDMRKEQEIGWRRGNRKRLGLCFLFIWFLDSASDRHLKKKNM
jgi:hypothetical protein